jgi:hypothetical protein
VWPLPVVVADVDAEDVLELAATEDQQPVEFHTLLAACFSNRQRAAGTRDGYI